jgi:3-hydroxymyristoyl/3-hydroxydecanoyl-(acyl carrier protein) dehydratase
MSAAGEPFAEVTLADGVVRARVRAAFARALCAGHFPGDPLLPGAYLAALMTEAAARLHDGAALRELVRCAFHKRVRPDDEIVVEARAAGEVVLAEVQVSGVCAARATLRFGEAHR